jgi:hypothetical protein
LKLTILKRAADAEYGLCLAFTRRARSPVIVGPT